MSNLNLSEFWGSIHYINNSDHYSCKKITFNYLLKYGYRYASEISKAISVIKPFLDKEKQVNIFSVGCGPSTELYGAIDSLQDMTICYKGFDCNSIWSSIQDINIEQFDNTRHSVEYSYINFFDYMSSSKDDADILIINYLFSDMVKFKFDTTEDFISRLSELLLLGKFKWVVINDIPLFYNKKTGYICMEKLSQKLKSTDKYEISVHRYHYAIPNQYQVTYGEKICNSLCFPIDEQIRCNFQPFSTCGSILQIISIKEKQL